VNFVRRINAAEIEYANSSGNQGYTCKLGDLASQLAEPSIDPNTLQFQRYGYSFVLEGCDRPASPEANSGYRVAAAPVVVNTTGARMFCSDESGVIKSATASTSVEDCLQNGALLQ